MVIPRDTVDGGDKEEFEFYLRTGRPYPKPKQEPRPEPIPPVVKNQIHFKDIPDGPVFDIEARMKNHRNATGVSFVGRDVRVQFEGGRLVEGWLSEGDFLELRKRIPSDRIDLLKKISF